MIHTCKTCSIFFSQRGNRARSYCSKQCYGAKLKLKQSKTETSCIQCSKIFLVWPYEKRQGRKLCSYACAYKASDMGKTAEAMKIRMSKAYRDWRKAVFERDGYTCQSCGTVGGTLNADHIKPFSKFPNLRLELSNGRTLCIPCHKETDTFGWKLLNNSTKATWSNAV